MHKYTMKPMIPANDERHVPAGGIVAVITAERIYGIVNTRIQACTRRADVWQDETVALERCRLFERVLASYVEIFYIITALEESWREDVFQGVTNYDANVDERIRELYRQWLAGADRFDAILGRFEVQYPDGVEGADDYRRCREKAELVLREWQPPSLSPAIGLREMRLNPDASAKVRDMLKRAAERSAAKQ